MLDLVERTEKRQLQNPNLVPIIDMFVCIIFFLLLTTSFLALTKVTVPPSRVSTITDPVAPPPLAPKILLTQAPGGMQLTLYWVGKQPGEFSEIVAPLGELSSDETKLKVLEATQKMTEQFTGLYPTEKSVQVGLGGGIPYQLMLSVMDGARGKLPDIVLISYAEAEARNQQAPVKPAPKPNQS